MKSLVYDFDEEFLSNEAMGNPIGFLQKERNRIEYNRIINEIYKDINLNNDPEILRYLQTLEIPEHLQVVKALLSIKWIRNDKEIFFTLQRCNNWFHLRELLNMINKASEEIVNNKLDGIKKLFLILPYLKGDGVNFINYIFQKIEYLDEKILELLFDQGQKNWDIHIKKQCEKILESELIEDKKIFLKYFFQIRDIYPSINRENLYSFTTVCNIEKLANDAEELKRLVYLANNVTKIDDAVREYSKIYKYPEIFNNSELREYLFNVLKVSVEEGIDNNRYVIVLNACLYSKIRNNKQYLDALANANSWLICLLLNNVFKCDEITADLELMSLILSMPNYWCLEQLLLAYETPEIKNNIDIIKKIASLQPFSDKMKEERLKYGYNQFELEWMSKCNDFIENQYSIDEEVYNKRKKYPY